jgi:pimeloyl-ACP methyl ester carboxylesterase
MRGQGLETDIVDYDSLRVLAMDVLAVLRTVQEDKKRYKIGAKMHVVGYSIGAGVAMWIGVLLSPNRRGGERLTRPKVDSISLYGFTSKGVIAGRKNFIDRVLTQAFATEMFVRACGIRGFIGLVRLGIRPNYDALNAQKMNVDDLTHYTCDTNTLDGFAYQVKSWTTFELSRDEIKSIEIPTLILHCKGDERAGHKREHKRFDAETMPRGEFLQIQGDYSHLWPYENPEQFVRVVEEFQNRASARRL